jgi:hypothetical protein
MPVKHVRPRLFVEGVDDKHVVKHLLKRHGYAYDGDSESPYLPEIKEVKMGEGELEGVEQLLKAMPLAVKDSGGRPVGFALDANDSLANRWAQVAGRLRPVIGSDLPPLPPQDGFIITSKKYRCPVGVWLMPDNAHEGKLETLLSTLVPDQDSLFRHAEEATGRAVELGARFPSVDHIKAVIHTWLAWQETPGMRLGSAIGARFFRDDGPPAVRFVAWFRRLFGLPPIGSTPVPANISPTRSV